MSSEQRRRQSSVGVERRSETRSILEKLAFMLNMLVALNVLGGIFSIFSAHNFEAGFGLLLSALIFFLFG